MKATLERCSWLSCVLILLASVGTTQAFYNPSTGRWLNRDPLGEPAFELRRERPTSLLAGEPGHYLFVKNGPVNFFDPLGLDIWIIVENSGLVRHQWVVGNNADGTYWSSDFMPNSQNILRRSHCQGTINYDSNTQVLNPTNLSSEVKILSHTGASQAVTDSVRDYAKKRSEETDQPMYNACMNSCIHWAQGLSRKAIGLNVREELDKIKNAKK